MLFFTPRSHPSLNSSVCEYSRIYAPFRTHATLLVLTLAHGTLLFNVSDSKGAPVQRAQRSTKAAQTTTSPRQPAAYRIGPEDILEVRLANHPLLDRTLTVRPDGKITFPRAGDVQAAGRTPAALAAQLKRLLERTLNNVRVEVEVKTAQPRLARVIGAVKTPNAYGLKPNWRIVDLIAAAGGLTVQQAERVSGRIIRRGRTFPIDVARVLAQPNSAANFVLLPDDLLVLDESLVPYQVTVSGKVAKPGAYDLEEGLTLTKLLARSGGITEGAALKKAQVLRRGVPIEIDISETELQNPASRAARFTLKEGDVLVVPENQERYGLLGQVVRPAYYPLPEKREDTTLLKLLASAGGAMPDADLINATLTRVVDGQPQVTTVNLSAMLEGEAPDTQTLQPGDVLFVPRRTAQVHAIGRFAKPGAYDLRDDMTLMSLISEAGSPATGAGLSKAYVMREGTQIPLDLYRVLIEGKVDPQVSQFQLRSGDVLVIPDVSAQVSVIGQVTKPGAFNLDDRLTVPSLVAQAGSPTPEAALAQAYVLRDGARLPLDLRSFLVGGAIDTKTENFRFQSGDVLVVPENKVRFAVMGQVVRPGDFSYPEDPSEATVLKALARAGGPLQVSNNDISANIAAAGIVRTVNGQATIIPVDVNALLRKGSRGDVPLQPGDVLYIPPKKRGFKLTDVLGPISVLGNLLR